MATQTFRQLVLTSIGTLLLATSAHAIPIAIYDTGVDNSGVALSQGSPDSHYQLFNATGTQLPDAVVTNPPPPRYWIANSSTSAWIGNTADQGNAPPGDYTFTTAFVLPNTADLASVTISGNWAADNTGLDILLNGISTGQTTTDYRSYAGFSLTSGFVVGTNTISFLVRNFGASNNPMGLRVDGISGSYQLQPTSGAGAVPAPASLSLLGLGLTLFGFLRARKKSH